MKRDTCAATATIFDLRRHCIHDGPGIRTTVFLKGCPLACPWCHNPEGIDARPSIVLRPERCLACGSCASVCPTGAVRTSCAGNTVCTACGACSDVCPSSARERAGRKLSISELVRVATADESYYGSDGGVTFSGGEPLAQPDFLVPAVLALEAAGIHRAIDTSGYADAALFDQLIGHVDLWLYDLKYFSDEEHAQITGKGNKIIHANMKTLARAGQNVLFSVPLIPRWNDSSENMHGIAELIASTLPPGTRQPYPVRILPYHGSAQAKYHRLGYHYACATVKTPSVQELDTAANIFRSLGIQVYIGGLA